jgi:hypothetical protein
LVDSKDERRTTGRTLSATAIRISVLAGRQARRRVQGLRALWANIRSGDSYALVLGFLVASLSPGIVASGET